MFNVKKEKRTSLYAERVVITKSLYAANHILHLKQAFELLDFY